MLLQIDRLKVRYGAKTALTITKPIVIEKGDRVGIIGSNGAGKSTLVKSLLGLVPYEGEIRTNLRTDEMAAHMQFNEYADTMAVKHIMEAVLQTRIRNNKRLQELIEFFEFEECLSRKYKVLSGGQKQRFTIILVMMQDAPLTFYDEVTSGLDFETRKKLTEKLARWYQEKEGSLMVVSHYYEELEHLAEKLLILDHGKVVDFGRKDALFHKYCGRAILLVERTPESERLLQPYDQLISPTDYIALSCESEELEERITAVLLRNNCNYKRSNHDIELLFLNAKERAGQEWEEERHA